MDNFKDRVTIYEVAKTAKVSLATVSRVINNKGNVTESTKNRVEEAIRKLGYKPSSLAQSLATSKTTNIAIILPAANYVYISNMLSGMIDVGRIYGYRCTVFTSDSSDDSEGLINDIITSRCDGAIVFGSQLTKEDVEKLISYNVTTLIVGNNITSEKIGSVEIDYNNEIKRVIKSYLDKGIQDIAMLKYKKENMYFLNDVTKAVEETFKEYGLEYNNYIEIDDSYNGTYKKFDQLFKENKMHKVYIAPRDSLAAAIINAANDNNKVCPEDFETLAIIGTKYSIMTRPTISSMSVDMYEVGSVAARMLTKLLAGKLENKLFKLTGEYIQRQSTK